MNSTNKLALSTLGLLVSMGGSFVLWRENRAINEVLEKSEGSYMAFLDRKVNGKPLYQIVEQDTLGAFRLNGQVVVCAVAKDSGIPARSYTRSISPQIRPVIRSPR